MAFASSAWAEVLYQHGQHVDAFPIAATPETADAPAMPGSASARNTYALIGGEYTVGPVVGRYNVSYGRYGDVDTREWLHEPAVGYTVNEHLALLGELVFWNRSAPGADTTLDRSFNVTLHGHF